MLWRDIRKVNGKVNELNDMYLKGFDQSDKSFHPDPGSVVRMIRNC